MAKRSHLRVRGERPNGLLDRTAVTPTPGGPADRGTAGHDYVAEAIELIREDVQFRGAFDAARRTIQGRFPGLCVGTLDRLALHAAVFHHRVGGRRARRKERQRTPPPSVEPPPRSAAEPAAELLQLMDELSWASLSGAERPIDIVARAQSAEGVHEARFSVVTGPLGLVELERIAVTVGEAALGSLPAEAANRAIEPLREGFRAAYQVAAAAALRHLEDRFLLAIVELVERLCPNLSSRDRAWVVGAVMVGATAWKMKDTDRADKALIRRVMDRSRTLRRRR